MDKRLKERRELFADDGHTKQFNPHLDLIFTEAFNSRNREVKTLKEQNKHLESVCFEAKDLLEKEREQNKELREMENDYETSNLSLGNQANDLTELLRKEHHETDRLKERVAELAIEVQRLTLTTKAEKR